jgi:hypothetical protein
VWLEGEERDFILSIRKEINIHLVPELLEQLLAEIEEKKKALPAAADAKILSDWLVGTRLKGLVLNSVPPSLLEPAEGTNHSLGDRAQALFHKLGVPAKVLCCVESGSFAHNVTGIGVLFCFVLFHHVKLSV